MGALVDQISEIEGTLREFVAPKLTLKLLSSRNDLFVCVKV